VKPAHTFLSPLRWLFSGTLLLQGGSSLLSAGLPAAGVSPKPHTILAIQGTRFTLNGRPTFLLGFSYYGALGAPEDFIRKDLDDLQRLGFNWLRVFATWDAFDNVISAVDAKGNPREPFFAKLKWLVAECDSRGMVVDITLARQQTERVENAGGMIPNLSAHRQSVKTLVEALKAHRNWYLDLANERDVGDARFVGLKELKNLRDQARTLDPARLVTASFGGHDLSEKDVRDALLTVGLDFLSPHRPRHAGSPGETKAQTRASLAIMKRIGRLAPVHYQEPFRRGYGRWQPKADDFVADVRGALTGGAAGWCFHNGGQRGAPDERPRRSFDMRRKRLMDQLDAEERRFVREARTAVKPGSEVKSNH
jgi:hypothetical protein